MSKINQEVMFESSYCYWLNSIGNLLLVNFKTNILCWCALKDTTKPWPAETIPTLRRRAPFTARLRLFVAMGQEQHGDKLHCRSYSETPRPFRPRVFQQQTHWISVVVKFQFLLVSMSAWSPKYFGWMLQRVIGRRNILAGCYNGWLAAEIFWLMVS